MERYNIDEFLLLPIEKQKGLFNERCIIYTYTTVLEYPFLHAIRYRDLKLMKYFIDNGIDINFEMEFLGKPNGDYLEWAIDKVFLEGVVLLLEKDVIVKFNKDDRRWKGDTRWELINDLKRLYNII